MARVEQKNAIPSPNQTGSDVDSTCRSYTNTSEEVDNGQVLSTERASSGDNVDHVHADARNENSDGTEPSAIIIDAVDQSINSESVANVQAATKESKIASADARQENSNGMELEMAVEDQNDIVDLQESVINNFCSLMPELTRRDSPPPYKSVLRERSTIQPPDCEEVSTTTDNNTVVDVNVITTQPQSNIANSPSVAADRDSAANYNQDKRGGTDETKCCDNLDLFCTVCYMCTPSGDTSQEHGNCTRGCCELLLRCTCDQNGDDQPDCNCGGCDGCDCGVCDGCDCDGCDCGVCDGCGCGVCDGCGCDCGDCDCCDCCDCTIM